MTLFFFSSVGMVKGLETTARELASSVVERGEVDCFKERDGQADASALGLLHTTNLTPLSSPTFQPICLAF